MAVLAVAALLTVGLLAAAPLAVALLGAVLLAAAHHNVGRHGLAPIFAGGQRDTGARAVAPSGVHVFDQVGSIRPANAILVSQAHRFFTGLCATLPAIDGGSVADAM